MIHEDLIARLYEAVGEIDEEHKFYNSAFLAGQIGPWEQFDDSLIYSTKAWSKVLGISPGPQSLYEYIQLIEDEKQREKVRKARLELITQNRGTRWSETFMIAGKKVKSSAFITKKGTLVGVDAILDPES